MRMRYERRDPRPEDLREIEELRSRIEAQDRDLRRLTEKLRELQMLSSNQQQQPTNNSSNNDSSQQQRSGKGKNKKSKLNCDVIYEENEDSDISPKAVGVTIVEESNL